MDKTTIIARDVHNEHSKILAGMRLRGKALEWVHSKAEFLSMFHHRPSRKILKIESSRNVIGEESFRDYIHEKIILSSILRDQARVSGLTTKTDLLTAFERINLWERKLPGVRTNEFKGTTIF
ncbi:Protein THO1 [Vespula maculifrons]|uniref:Protein THO1 n=1 Tax=Vespula maculifrons TaxID=7453 RepID=A0ABD2AVB0_VESMC